MKLVFYGVITLAIFSGLFLPGLKSLSAHIPLLIACMLFFNFLDVKFTAARILRKELIVTSLLTVIIMPLITHHVLSVKFAYGYRVGLLLVACAPAGIMGNILLRYLEQRDYPLAFSNFLFSTFGSIFFIPLVLKLFLGQTAPVEIRPILVQTAVLITAPYLATRLLNRFGGDAFNSRIRKAADFLIPVAVFLIVSTSIASASGELKWSLQLLSLSAAVFAIYFVQAGLGYLAGYLLKKEDVKNTLTLISSSRNCQLILAVAILNFSPLATVPIIIATIFHHLMNAVWLWVLQK
jgi:hypothetical protein